MCIAYFQPITRADRQSARRRLDRFRSPQPDTGSTLHLCHAERLPARFRLETLRYLPDFEALEDAGLLSEDKLLAGRRDTPMMAFATLFYSKSYPSAR